MLLGDLDAAEEHLHLALGIHGLDRRRTRAMILAERQPETRPALIKRGAA
ncbi:hypothetical protein ACFCZ6_00940 [Streptomyces hydrogenans]